MSVVVSFVRVKGIGSASAPGIGGVRATEVVALDGTTTESTQEDEVILIGNAEASMILAAFGSTPDAAATEETPATSSGFPIAAGTVTGGIPAPEGSKVSVKAIA